MHVNKAHAALLLASASALTGSGKKPFPKLRPLKSALAQCLLIRFAKKVMEEEPSGENRDRALFDYLESSLRHKSDMVIYEAASAICSLTNVTQRELSPGAPTRRRARLPRTSTFALAPARPRLPEMSPTLRRRERLNALRSGCSQRSPFCSSSSARRSLACASRPSGP